MTECEHENAHECDCGAKCCSECNDLKSLKAELEEITVSNRKGIPLDETQYQIIRTEHWKQIWAKRGL